jgi:chloride channel protein, CIC family
MIRIGQTLWKRFYHQLLRANRFAVLEACSIGLVSAIAAVFLKDGVGWLGGWRIQLTHRWSAWIVLPALGLVGGLLAGWLVERIAPETSGSGIPQVKAVLGKVPVALDLRVAVIKLLGGVLALGSGLPLGREGPTVQIGSALAATLSRRFPTSPDHRRQLIAAGAGAGLAAAFNAPIAGVLFVVEELLQDVSNLTLGTAILASFIGSTVSRWLGGQGLDLKPSDLVTSFAAQDIPFYFLLGLLAGLLGALFNRSILLSLTFYRRFSLSLPLRIGLAGLTTGTLLALLPIPFRDSAGLKELLMIGSSSWQFSLTAFIVQGALTLIAYGSGAPGGLFAPALILGAALGSLVGGLEQSLIGAGSSATFALAGMGIFFSAVARVPITSIVIVFEMTMDFNLVLPLMMGSGISYLVAETLSPGSLYDQLLEWSGIRLEKNPTLEGAWAGLKAADIMKGRVETLPCQLSLSEALQAFSKSSHRTFPIMDGGKLVGILTQSDLATIAQRRLDSETPIREIMTPDPVTVGSTDSLAHVLNLLNRYSLNSLPVTEGRRLVGIITRSDIIRTEVAHLDGGTEQTGPKPDPSHIIYQSRMPETGQGRLLVPLSNPNTAPVLLRMAIAIARDRRYEIECVQIIVIPRHYAPAEAPVKPAASQRLLQDAARLGEAWQVSIHTQIRVGHDLAFALLEVIKEQHIDLLLMGWKGSTTTAGRVFSRAVDTMIRQATCEVMLVKLSIQPVFDRWLIPMAGGPNAQDAVRLLPGLISLGRSAQVRLLHVCSRDAPHPDAAVLALDAQFLHKRVGKPVLTTAICAESVANAVLDYAGQDGADVIMLGASREGLLQQAIQGNVPSAIARSCSCTVILVRKPLS